MMKRERPLLILILAPALLILCVTSYVRFMVNHDYMVAYEIECDPSTQECFVGCDDDECSEPYYYAEVTKYAADLYAQCGPDITECGEAAICTVGDTACEITFCESGMEGAVCDTEQTTAKLNDTQS